MNADRDLVISRDIAAPSGQFCRCRTEASRKARKKMGVAAGWGIGTDEPVEPAAVP